MPEINNLYLQNGGRRGTVIVTDYSGSSFNGFSGVVNSTLPAASGSSWAPLYQGMQELLDGDIKYIRLTSTDNLFPSVEDE